MPLNQFPVLPGLAWSVTKEPAFRTRIQKSVSGRERRANDQPLPIWTWTLTYDFLRDNVAGGYNELRTMMAFHAQQQGAYTGFLYTDLNGVVQSSSSYSVNANNGIVTFNTAPGSGVVVTADFSYFFRVRFSDDTASFENFMYQLWKLKQIKFISILQ